MEEWWMTNWLQIANSDCDLGNKQILNRAFPIDLQHLDQENAALNTGNVLRKRSSLELIYRRGVTFCTTEKDKWNTGEEGLHSESCSGVKHEKFRNIGLDLR